MKIQRRDFLKWAAVSAAALGIGKVELSKISYAMETMEHTPVLWLQGASCSGCTISFMNMVEDNIGGPKLATIDKLLMGTNEHPIDLKYHQNLMVASAHEAYGKLANEMTVNAHRYILIVEGGIPTAHNGLYCIIGDKKGQPWTAQQAVLDLGAKAKHIIAVGTCASFKGVAGAGANPTGVRSVEDVLPLEHKTKVLNLPGCPVHPYIIGETIIKLILDISISKDNMKRPLGSYSLKELHGKDDGNNNCPLKDRSKTKHLGVCGQCFDNMGCKGKDKETKMTCYTRYWGTDWTNRKGCFGTGNMCIGCASSNFPFSSIYS